MSSIKAVRYEARDITDEENGPDDVGEKTFDVVAYCDDAVARYSPEVFATRDEAEVHIAGWELKSPDFQAWDHWKTLEQA